MRSILRSCAALGTIVALALAGSASAQVVHQAPAGMKVNANATNVDWPSFGNTADNTRFSPLSQINSSNVDKLGVAWTAQEGANLSTFETVPIVINGVMYYTTNLDQVRAVDAATGKVMWQFSPKVNFYLAIAGGGGGVPTNRGVTVANGRVYLLTFDDQLIALQQATGEKIWDTTVADPNQGYSETSPAAYWNGLLIVGSAESDAGLRGFVAAYDANTGKQVWRFYTVPAAGDSWMPKVGEHGGGDVWMPPVVDAKTGLVYFGTGNPSPDLDNSQRPGCNPWVDATVALNAKTGKFVWAHSEVCNDVWDYDSHQSPMIFDVQHNGMTVHAVGHGNKSGLYFVYDAATGKVLSESPHLGDYSMPHLKPTPAGVKVCPGATGGIEFSPPAYSPATKYAYEPGLNLCMKFTLQPIAQTNLHKYGQVDFGGSIAPVGNVTGFMAAVNTDTGKIAWKVATPKNMVGGALATAGNLVFSGCGDGNIYAFDAATGKVLWKGDVGLDTGAAPITYEVNGTQYIALAVGGSSAAALFHSPLGGTLVVLKLNGKPIAKQPIVSTPATQGVGAAPSIAGMTEINPYMYASAKTQRMVIDLTAAATTTNNGFNFDGYAKGSANFIVPAGWDVDWIVTNKSAIPHSAALASTNKPNPPLVTLGVGPVEIPNAVQGITTGVKDYVSFAASAPGKYYLVCLVPGHITAGMWDDFTVSSTAHMPSISTTGAP